jgi:predicted phage-related endonuclease
MLIQGTPEWRIARAGSLGASSFHEAVAMTRGSRKSGTPVWGASRYNLMGRLIAERLTGRPIETYQNAAMRWGNQVEPEARALYGFMHDVDLGQVGLVRHPIVHGAHASPDALIGADGMLEIKSPETHTHIDTLLHERIPQNYVMQMQWQMACTGRDWVDYLSYDPRLPDDMQLFIKRVPRDDLMIKIMEQQARDFVAELEDKLGQVCKKHDVPIPVWGEDTIEERVAALG